MSNGGPIGVVGSLPTPTAPDTVGHLLTYAAWASAAVSIVGVLVGLVLLAFRSRHAPRGVITGHTSRLESRKPRRSSRRPRRQLPRTDSTMTQRHSPRPHKRIVLPLDHRTAIITSDKTVMAAMTPDRSLSLHSVLARTRAQRRDQRRPRAFEVPRLQRRRTPDRSEYVATTDRTPATLGKTAPLAIQELRPLATYTRVSARPARWWDVTIGTAGIAVLAAAAAVAAASVAAAIGRGDAR